MRGTLTLVCANVRAAVLQLVVASGYILKELGWAGLVGMATLAFVAPTSNRLSFKTQVRVPVVCWCRGAAAARTVPKLYPHHHGGCLQHTRGCAIVPGRIRA